MKFIDETRSALQRNSSGDIWKLAMVGWFFGVTSIMLPCFLLIVIPSGLSGNWWEPVLIIFMVPFIALLQSVVVGVLVVFGLNVFKVVFSKKVFKSE